MTAADLSSAIARRLDPGVEPDLPAGAPPVDLNAALRAVGGDPALLRELVHLFLQDYPSHMTALQEALRRGDAEPVIRTAHSLQGALSIIGGPLAATLASELERMGGAGALEDACRVLPPLERELAGIATFYTDHGWAALP
jgi:HPt (histidine-containing phosphotransfer) domain-containing protein